MYLEQISKLVEFLAMPTRDLSELCRFLVLDTFSPFNPRSIYIAELVDEGMIAHVASFGFKEKAIRGWSAFPLTVQIPITDAIKYSKCVMLDSFEESLEKFPYLKGLENYDNDWKAFISMPMLRYGGYSLVLSDPRPKHQEFNDFLKAVGHLIALHQLRKDHCDHKVTQSRTNHVHKKGESLTPRQQQIKLLIEKGMSNPAIASTIGYSESLVRHETIEIYAKLHVSGRKELIQKVSQE